MSGFALVVFFTLLFSAFLASSVGTFITEDWGGAEEHRAALDEYAGIFDYRHANITIKRIVYTRGDLDVTLENTGGVVLDPDHVFITIDDRWLPEGSYSVVVPQSPRGYWEPGEELLLKFTQSLGPGWHTLKVIAGKGVYAERSFYLPYDAMMVYYDSWAPWLPRYRFWDGSQWSEERAAGNVGGDILWMVLRAAPTRNEYVLITLDANGDINGQAWQNDSWLGPVELTANANPRYRGFDAAYEQVSGDVVVVYSDGTSLPKYLVWNGTAITQRGSVLPIGTGTPLWITLASNPNSDEIILVTLDTNRDIYAQVWDGNAWGNVILLELNAETSRRQCFDAAYEHSSGRALVVWADSFSARPQYRIWNGASWSAEGSANDVGSSNIYWIKLASEPRSNRILMGVLDSGNDVNVQTWTGSWWGANFEVTTLAETDGRRTFDVAFEGFSGVGMIAYGVSNDRPRYRTCDGDGCNNGVWSNEDAAAEADGGTGDPEWINLVSDPESNDIMLVHVDDDSTPDVGVQRWRGSPPWVDVFPAETRSRFDYESFSLAYRVFKPEGYAWD